MSVIVHCAGTAKGDDLKARHLVEAARRAGVRHLVFISVVGADRVPVVGRMDRAMFGFFASKRAAEQVVATSGIPWTTVRATQFHELTFRTVAAIAKLPLAPVPKAFRFQPIGAGDVADRLVELALEAPAGLAPAVGGPTIYEMADLVRSYLRAAGKSRPVVALPMPGRAAAAIRAGVNLAPDRAVGRTTWEEYLATHVRSSAAERQATIPR